MLLLGAAAKRKKNTSVPNSLICTWGQVPDAHVFHPLKSMPHCWVTPTMMV
jgi:hypothetical protein